MRDILAHDTRARPECYEDMSLNNWNQALVFLEKTLRNQQYDTGYPIEKERHMAVLKVTHESARHLKTLCNSASLHS